MDLNTVIMAVLLSAPNLPETQAVAYAKTIYSQSTKLEQDPLITIAIIEHESKWNSKVISKDGFDYGLMQIRAKYYTGPATNLLNPWINIRIGSYWIKSSFKFCEKQLGREPLTQEYLSCYQGTCRSKKTGKWCQPTKMTNRVEKYAACLQVNIESNMSLEDCNRIYKLKL